MARMFGTDGVRGVAGTELTIDLAMKLGQAGAYVLTKEQSHQPTIIVGCDTRISGGMLANALMAGICSVGANAIYVGVAPTPAIAYLTKRHKVDAGVVISASHNPMEFNGIKFFNGEGYKLSDQLEDEIEALIRNNMEDVVFPIGPGIGRVEYRLDIVDEYIEFEKKTVPVDLSGLKVVVDCAEGASSYTSVKALRDLGADLIAIHTNPDGTNINAILRDENCVNLGSVYETVVAQELHAHGYSLHYYDNKQKGEVDYLIDDYENLSVLPIEIKSGKDYRIHSALDRFLQTPDYHIKQAVVLSNAREVSEANGVVYLPVYYCMFYERDRVADDSELIIPEIIL